MASFQQRCEPKLRLHNALHNDQGDWKQPAVHVFDQHPAPAGLCGRSPAVKFLIRRGILQNGGPARNFRLNQASKVRR